MRKLIAALVALLALAAPAHATAYLFSVDLFDPAGVSRPAYSFAIDSDPTPAAFDDSPGFSYFKVANVAITAAPGYTPAPATPADLLFFDQITGGAFSTADFVTINYFGTQLFTGPVSAPTFQTGTTDLYASSGDVVGTIRIADAGVGAVPEPATWLLMVGGMGLAGATLRRRRSLAPA